MKTLRSSMPVLAAAALTFSALTAAAAPVVVADWAFAEAASTALKNTVNSGAGVGGAGTSFDSNISGVATNGSGALVVRNAGGGGSGTRTAYADLGPVATGTITSGIVSLYSSFSAWNLVGAPASGGPALTLSLIEGNDFSVAQFSLSAGSGGLKLSGAVDPTGDGTNLASSGAFASSGAGLTVRLSVDLDLLSYSLAYDLGSGYTTLGQGVVDSLTQGVNSLRLGVNGNFALNVSSGLSIDRLWVVQNDRPAPDASAVPEPGTGLLALGGLGLAAAWRRRRA